MDRVLNDLQSWKLNRAVTRLNETTVEEDTSTDLLEQSLAREKALLAKFNRFEEQKNTDISLLKHRPVAEFET